MMWYSCAWYVSKSKRHFSKWWQMKYSVWHLISMFLAMVFIIETEKKQRVWSGSKVRTKDWRKLTVQPAARRMSSWVSSATWGSWLGKWGRKVRMLSVLTQRRLMCLFPQLECHWWPTGSGMQLGPQSRVQNRIEPKKALFGYSFFIWACVLAFAWLALAFCCRLSMISVLVKPSEIFSCFCSPVSCLHLVAVQTWSKQYMHSCLFTKLNQNLFS